MKLTPIPPTFPSVGEDGKISETHLPDRLSEAEIAKALGQYRGAGFPEGKVAAPVGSIYTDTLATAGAVRWIKTTGTGNTGWAVEYGNTGVRKLATFHTDGTLTNHTSLSDPSGFGAYSDTDEGGIWARRVNRKVTIYLRARVTGSQVIRLPVGFRPTGNPYPITTIAYSGTDSRNAAVGGNSIFLSIPTGSTISAFGRAYSAPMNFDTDIDWPSTLPGIPD